MPGFDFGRDYVFQEQLHGLEGRPSSGLRLPGSAAAAGAASAPHYGPQWALLRFHHPVTAPQVCTPGRLSPCSRLCTCAL